MIIPFPSSIKEVNRIPLTVTLSVLNVFIFMLIFSGASGFLSHSRMLSEEGLVLTGRLYYQFMKDLPVHELYAKPDWVHKLHSQNREHLAVLGSYALRDARFIEAGDQYPFVGDEVKIGEWRQSLQEFRKKYKSQMLFRFGLSAMTGGPWAWLTYQFSHSTWMHLLSNLIFLVAVGAAVETLAGSGVLLLIYLLGGIGGGWGFLISQAHGTVPMVGASASISALLAFYLLAETRRRIRYFYFIIPIEGYYGSIYLPTLLIFPLFLLVDVASFWGTPEGLGGGVAYAAHLGGTFVGLVMGLLYRYKPRATLTQS